MQEDVQANLDATKAMSKNLADGTIHKLSAKSRRKLFRRSSLRKSTQQRSLEDHSSSTASSPENTESKSVFNKSSKDSKSIKNFREIAALVGQDKPSPPQKCLLERSVSEPSISFCHSITKKDDAVISVDDQMRNISVEINPGYSSEKTAVVCDETKVLGVKSNHSKKKAIGHVRSRSDIPVSILRQQIQSNETESQANQKFFIRPGSCSSTLNAKECINRRKSLLEEGCCSVAPQTECFFPQPHKGQSLTSFLSSEDFHTCAELDKENAHFYISEALISAVEQIKCNQSLQRAEDENDDDSDEEIFHLKQRIRIRRRERQQEKAVLTKPKSINLLSDGKTDTTTSQSASSPRSSTYSEQSDYSSSEDIDELELSDTNNTTLNSIQEKGLSLSMASLYSDADVKRFQTLSDENSDFLHVLKVKSPLPEPTHIPVSAEVVALCLLKKFSEKQLPKASDLEWLVSEQEVPQRLLPLPDSWPVSPDDVDEEISSHRTRLRGTVDWAPPRAQIIFNIHPGINRKLVVAKQKFRCAGCGMRIEKDYLHRFRYCKYLGKYFCQCCHSNSTAVIPAYVLHKWDFSQYYVSNFSRDLLDRMDADPLFNITAINASLFKKCRQLDHVRQCRLQLCSLKDYIGMCKDSGVLKNDIASLPYHFMTEPEMYSLFDLVQIKRGKMPDELRQLTAACVKHALNCVSCNSRGFICEMCRNADSIIFPFQLNSVVQCKDCGACFHKECHVKNRCPKCARIQLRKVKLEEEVFSDEES